MKTKKGFGLWFLALLTMVLFMTACGEKRPKVEVISEELPQIEEDNTTEEIENEKVNANKEILNEEMYGLKIQVGKEILEFPLNVVNLEKAGMSYENSSINSNYMIEPDHRGNVENFFMVLGDPSKKTELIIYKDREKIIQLKDSYAYRMNTDDENIIFPKGVRAGMSYDDLINTWGEPTTLNISSSPFSDDNLIKLVYMKYPITNNKGEYFAAGKIFYTCSIDKSANIIKNIEYSYNPGSLNDVETTKIIINETHGDRKVPLEITKTIPTLFKDNPFYVEERSYPFESEGENFFIYPYGEYFASVAVNKVFKLTTDEEAIKFFLEATNFIEALDKNEVVYEQKNEDGEIKDYITVFKGNDKIVHRRVENNIVGKMQFIIKRIDIENQTEIPFSATEKAIQIILDKYKIVEMKQQ